MNEFNLKEFAEQLVNYRKNKGLHPDIYKRDKEVCIRETPKNIVKKRFEQMKVQAGLNRQV